MRTTGGSAPSSPGNCPTLCPDCSRDFPYSTPKLPPEDMSKLPIRGEAGVDALAPWMEGRFSKCWCAGADMVERESISDDMTSGDAGWLRIEFADRGPVRPWPGEVGRERRLSLGGRAGNGRTVEVFGRAPITLSMTKKAEIHSRKGIAKGCGPCDGFSVRRPDKWTLRYQCAGRLAVRVRGTDRLVGGQKSQSSSARSEMQAKNEKAPRQFERQVDWE